jgi:hypothetical protein
MALLRVTGWGMVVVALVACGGSSGALIGVDGGAADDSGRSSGSSSGSGSGGTSSSGGTTSGGSGSGSSSGGGASSGTAVTEAGLDSDTGAPADAGTPPDGGPACAGTECSGWASAVSAASSLRGAAGSSADQALSNCVIQLHQSDCCGARRAYGFNHAARTQLCTAESACTMTYPASPGCTNTTITTDTGETTTDPSQVRLRVVNPMSCSFGTCYTCETFVCAGGACMSAPGIMSTQCG